MKHIGPILMRTEERRHWEFTVQTQKERYGDPLPQYQKCQMHTYHNLQAYIQSYYFWYHFSKISIIEGRGRDGLK